MNLYFYTTHPIIQCNALASTVRHKISLQWLRFIFWPYSIFEICIVLWDPNFLWYGFKKWYVCHKKQHRCNTSLITLLWCLFISADVVLPLCKQIIAVIIYTISLQACFNMFFNGLSVELSNGNYYCLCIYYISTSFKQCNWSCIKKWGFHYFIYCLSVISRNILYVLPGLLRPYNENKYTGWLIKGDSRPNCPNDVSFWRILQQHVMCCFKSNIKREQGQHSPLDVCLWRQQQMRHVLSSPSDWTQISPPSPYWAKVWFYTTLTWRNKQEGSGHPSS